jgi:hypothetical protein
VKALPVTPELQAVARRVVWFEEPERALADPARFLAYAMTWGTHEDLRSIRRHASDDDMREALAHAPPGIFDPRSWSYWHLMLDCWPPPPLPARRFD